MHIDQEILERIPHRPPFLWVDTIVELSRDQIITKKSIPEDLDIFHGHYPNNPIVPGVLLCEAIFQTGALLMSYQTDDTTVSSQAAVPVLTRIESAKFKRIVRPGDSIEIQVVLTDRLANLVVMKGTVRIDGKVAVRTAFSCAMAPAQE